MNTATSSILHSWRNAANLAFVPSHGPVPWSSLRGLQVFVDEFEKLFVLTGAGVSTESGIPDYRSKDVGSFNRTPYAKPVTYQRFIASSPARQRYWARNYVGWPSFSSKQPNVAHQVLAKWEAADRISWLVTQNVDRLHHKAGSRNVTELHGTTYRVICHGCPHELDRHELQALITEQNPDFIATASQVTPDGDVELVEEQVLSFKTPTCPSCGGMLRPGVVFFGDNVPIPRVEIGTEKLRKSNALLVIGSSLSTFSAYRYLMQAVDEGIPIAILNIGETRGDYLADIKVEGRCSELLARLDV